MSDPEIVAAIDAGGTSFKCGLVRDDGTILKRWSVPTRMPDETLSACATSFASAIQATGAKPAALGIASFGPVDIDPRSAGYGTITGKAKPGWNGAAIGPRLSRALGLPFRLDTDVNAALAAEQRWGAATDATSAAYMTVGTGIGVGLFLNSGFVGQPTHPEFGHIRVARHPDDLDFPGTCPLHGDCLEGLASVPALTARWGDPEAMPPDHHGWDIAAGYLAQACLNLCLMTRLERIIVGGGLMNAPHLLAKVQASFDGLLKDYLPITGVQLICTPGLGASAGMLGGAVLALNALS